MIGGGPASGPKRKRKKRNEKEIKREKEKKKSIIRIKRMKLSKTINDRTENNKSER